MLKQITINLNFLYILFIGLTTCKQTTTNNGYLLSFTDTVTNKHGYKNQNGDIVVPAGKYLMCFTDTFRTYAVVAKPSSGFLAIDRKETVLYEVYPFDNGPDMPADGLFRILVNKKIGYADSATGKIMIQPQFDCAWPFENGVTKVSMNCQTQIEGEHCTWLSDNWYYINKAGKKVANPKKVNE